MSLSRHLRLANSMSSWQLKFSAARRYSVLHWLVHFASQKGGLDSSFHTKASMSLPRDNG
jgi:hypothetical protein